MDTGAAVFQLAARRKMRRVCHRWPEFWRLYAARYQAGNTLGRFFTEAKCDAAGNSSACQGAASWAQVWLALPPSAPRPIAGCVTYAFGCAPGSGRAIESMGR